MGDDSCNGNQLSSVLSAQQKRVLRALMNETELAPDPILHEGEMLNPDDYLIVIYELHHVLLPALEERQLITFDRSNKTIYRGPRFDDIRPLLS